MQTLTWIPQAIFSVKHSSKKPFMQETYEDFTESIESYVGGAFQFAQLSLARFFEDHGEATLAEGAPKKGTLIFTGTLGALRCNAEFAAYGSGKSIVHSRCRCCISSMRMLTMLTCRPRQRPPARANACPRDELEGRAGRAHDR